MGNKTKLTIKEGYKLTEVGVIPEDWGVSTVGHEFEIKLGKMLDSEKNVGTLKPYLGNKSVQWNRIDISDLQLIAMTQADLKRFRLHKGDLLVCEGGEVGRAAIWDAPIDECYYQKALHRLRPLRNFNTKLLLEFLHYWSEQNLLSNYVTQTSIAHLTREKFAEIPLPVPPLPEQRAIAEALSDVDSLITSLEEVITKKRNIKQGAMQELLTGKKRLEGFSSEWETRKLGEIFDIAAGGDFIPKLSSDVKDEKYKYPIYSNSVSNKGLYGFSSYYTYKENALTVTARGTLGTANFRNHKFTAIGRLLVLHPKKSTDCFFVSEFINSRMVFVVESTGVPQLTAPQISSYQILLPPFPEQKAIAELLSDMDTEIESLEEKRDKYKAIKQGMMQELLTGKTRLV